MEVAVVRRTDKAEPETGIRCPDCHSRFNRVLETRAQLKYVRRRRECQHCGKRYTTSERVVG